MNKYRIYLGLNDSITKEQIIDTDTAYQLVYELIGDCTIQLATGYYQGIKELTLLIDIFTNDSIIEKCQHLNQLFNQECTIYEELTTNAEFIYSRPAPALAVA